MTKNKENRKSNQQNRSNSNANNQNSSNQNYRDNRIRNRLVGFATLLIMLAVAAPWILTDKSSSRTPTTPILQPSVVSAQNQAVASGNTDNNDITNNSSTSPADAPYITDTDQNIDLPIDPEVTPPNTTTQSLSAQSSSSQNSTSQSTATQSTATQSTATTQPNNKPTISAPESKPYIIQLAALKNRQKIEELVALLRLNNYNVRVTPKNPAPDQLIKLQVGPYAKKEQAEQVVIDLNNLTKLKGIIVAN